MKLFLTIATILITSISFGQDVVLDQNEKSEKSVDLYNSRAEKHSNPDSVFYYYNRAIAISQKIGYYKGELKACKGLIKLYENDKEIYDKLRYTLLMVRLYEKNGTNTNKAEGYYKLGKLYFNERLYTKSSETFLKIFDLPNLSTSEKYNAGIWLSRSQRYEGKIEEALITARTIQFEEALTVEQKIELLKEKAEIYNELRAYNEELAAYREIILISKGTEFERLHPTLWNNIGYVSKFLNRNAEAKKAFKKTLLTAGEDDKSPTAAANYNLGLIYHNSARPDSAMICFSNAEKIYSQLKDWPSVASSYNMKALSYYNSNDMFNAQRWLGKAFFLEANHNLKQQEAKSHEIQSLFHQELYDFEQALESYKKYLSIRDSLLTVERSEEFRLLFDQYQVEQIEKQLRLIWASNDLEMANLAKERAELEAQQEKDARIISENELTIQGLKYDALRQLQEFQLEEERLNLANKQKELDLIQRDNELKELALETERLLVSEKKKEIKLMAQQNELERQRRLNEKAGYQNKLRLIVAVLLFILLILLGILIAYRQLRRRKKQIEAQNVIIADSKKQIEIQKEKSDGLLLNILPVAIAEELKKNGVAKPKLFNEVSVGFTDFSGFTMISEKLSPEELVEKLDEMFLAFDRVIEKYGLHRIKTIGDSYMFVAGLPEPIEQHEYKCVSASIEMRDYIDSFNKSLPAGEPKWNIRIGVHSGPVVAGVIGIKKFAYDIWGDTVNTASRMESSGEVGKVNISGTTFSKVHKSFTMEHRGKIHAKNKGAIDMYFAEKL